VTRFFFGLRIEPASFSLQFLLKGVKLDIPMATSDLHSPPNSIWRTIDAPSSLTTLTQEILCVEEYFEKRRSFPGVLWGLQSSTLKMN